MKEATLNDIRRVLATAGSVTITLMNMAMPCSIIYTSTNWIYNTYRRNKKRLKNRFKVQPVDFFGFRVYWVYCFLQRVSIACCAERCTSYKSVRPSVRPSVTRWHCVKTTPATIMRSSLEDSPMTLVSSWLTSARNSKGNIGSEAPN